MKRETTMMDFPCFLFSSSRCDAMRWDGRDASMPFRFLNKWVSLYMCVVFGCILMWRVYIANMYEGERTLYIYIYCCNKAVELLITLYLLVTKLHRSGVSDALVWRERENHFDRLVFIDGFRVCYLGRLAFFYSYGLTYVYIYFCNRAFLSGVIKEKKWYLTDHTLTIALNAH